ncbi:MAG: hypothetical protein QOH31_3743 [Verrucomicrobiota bacterium]|jgi:hypothetical protein
MVSVASEKSICDADSIDLGVLRRDRPFYEVPGKRGFGKVNREFSFCFPVCRDQLPTLERDYQTMVL